MSTYPELGNGDDCQARECQPSLFAGTTRQERTELYRRLALAEATQRGAETMVRRIMWSWASGSVKVWMLELYKDQLRASAEVNGIMADLLREGCGV